MNQQTDLFNQLSEIFNPETMGDLNAGFDKITNDFRKQNSREARQSVEPKLGSLHRQILYTLKKIGEGSFYDIAQAANLENSQVWKRLPELVDEGLIEVTGRKMGMSGRNVSTYKIKHG